MRVAVIGAAGRMGKWFTQYFLDQSHEVSIFDTNTPALASLARKSPVHRCNSLKSAIEVADFCLLSVPLTEAPEVCNTVFQLARDSTVVAEVSSVKESVFPILQRAKNLNLVALSLHPLFGPGARSIAGQRIALIPVNNARKEMKIARSIFPDSRLVLTSMKEHDSAMATLLSVIHFSSIALTLLIREENLDLLQSLSGTSFRVALTLAESILGDSEDLLLSIQLENSYSLPMIRNYLEKALMMASVIESGDRRRLKQMITQAKKVVALDRESGSSYKRIYQMVETFQGNKDRKA
uniref:Prephenate dehydrogenase (TyrA2) n=1 Tax=uncultured marine thaumarchaeote KM3_72_A09 TaxID=1456261 RepID=A0A075HNI1_9ARCH|nr:prephenate dehydrogenase (tyrA2) [uncultured marine thaumarchaeote KM3_72_A09]